MSLHHQPENGPGPVLVDHDPRGDHVVTGVYGLVDLGFGARTHVVFVWAQAAPYVVRGFFTDPRNGVHRTWDLARQTLCDGNDDLDADVRVTWDGDTLHLTLCSPSGRARLDLDSAWIGRLLAATYDIVPVAAEWAGGDFPFAVLAGEPDRSGHRRPGDATAGGTPTAPDPDDLPAPPADVDRDEPGRDAGGCRW
ncbi:SsgA family sporulation/cell division regulator [Saccharothrix sp. HUAS TT1]|uniref:SsgA family sporulation/cell division regulator n=1 Tax=unclassified Saccharothrix TaxID=2593673 RepID=UPI00345BB042